jgi:ABC-2 type transport system ATP-binding protein
MTDYAIEASGLRRVYKGFALKDVSFRLPSGHVMGLIGPNGAGKTTIIKLLMNLIRRHAGEVRIFGLDNRQAEAEVKSRIGFVYDVACFFGDVTLRDHARAMSPFYSRWSDAQFRRLAGEFELPLDRKFKTLSLGMQTKFALALALAHDADLLIMDEPTAGLDPIFRRDLLRRLADLMQDDRRSILFSTHITTDLERIADFVTLIRDGEIVFSLSKDELLDSWAVVRGDDGALRALDPVTCRGTRRGPYGIEILTSDARAARERLGSDAVIDKATLEDVMVLVAGDGGRRAA